MKVRQRKQNSTGPKFGKRHVQTILLFTCFFLEYASRENFALAIVAMTENTSSNPNIPVYDWTNPHVLLSAFYWGFVVTQIPGGQLSKMFGSKYILLFASFINTVAVISIPVMAQWIGSSGVMVCRVLQGLTQGVYFPCVHTLLGKWVPPSERSRLTMLVYLGVAFGLTVANPITGWLSTSDVGWPASFYLLGSLGFGWCVVWYFFGHNSPASDPTITIKEKQYIESSLGNKEQPDIATPWKEILSSKHVWALVFGSIGVEYGNAFLPTEIPTYLNKVMNYDTASDGVMFSIPIIVGITCGFFYGFLSDFLVDKKYLSTINARRFFAMFAAVVQAFWMCVIAFLKKDQANLSVVFLCLANIGTGAELYGTSVNIMDISPRFAGVIIGITQTISMSLSLCGPLLVQLLVNDERNASEWRNIFFIGAAIYVIPTALFCLLASADKQWWDSGPKRKSKSISGTPEIVIPKGN